MNAVTIAELTHVRRRSMLGNIMQRDICRLLNKVVLSSLPNGAQFCCAAYQRMLPWRSNTAAIRTESAASAAIAC
jgi:hypothetical protein